MDYLKLLEILIPPCITLIGVLIANGKNRALTDYKINELKEEVEKHNGLIDRMYKIESRVTLLEDELKNK